MPPSIYQNAPQWGVRPTLGITGVGYLRRGRVPKKGRGRYKEDCGSNGGCIYGNVPKGGSVQDMRGGI
jgi:hypothetical protein